MFSSSHGGPLRKSFGRRTFKPAVAAAGLAPFRIHDLRHTAASLMIAEGAHELEIMKRLGHSSIQVTYDRYGHLMPDRDEALSARLDALARRTAASAPPDATSSLVLARRS